MKRLFTFGCSFTSYIWSTWADIVAPEFDEFQNWGQLGAGNQFIFNSVFECDQHNNFTKDDTVIVCWTNIMREDRYIDKWTGLGNVYTQPLYNPKWIKEWITERGCLIRDVAYIKAVKNFLVQKNVNWKFISMVPINQIDQYSPDNNANQDVLDLYSDVIESIGPSYWEVLGNQRTWEMDLHPMPLEHLLYVEKVLPEFTVSDLTKRNIMIEDSIIRSKAYAEPVYRNPKVKRL